MIECQKANEKRIAMQKNDYLFKLLLIGDANVGKQQIIHRYCPALLADPSIGAKFVNFTMKMFDAIDFKIKHLELKGKNIKLQIW